LNSTDGFRSTSKTDTFQTNEFRLWVLESLHVEMSHICTTYSFHNSATKGTSPSNIPNVRGIVIKKQRVHASSLHQLNKENDISTFKKKKKKKK